MAANTLSVLMPSVNNLTARIFVRAAGLDFEEVDVWGQTTTPEFLAKDPAHLTPLLEEEGLPRGSLWESCAIMQYLCNRHGIDRFYPTDPGERAMVDSAMFYLIGTLYPLVAYRGFFLDGKRFIGGEAPSIADIRLAATLEFLRAVDYEFPSWAEEYMSAVEDSLGQAYSEPAADVRGFVANAKSQGD